MAYNATIPADTEFIANGPADIRQNQEALRTQQIVDALALKGLSPGNASGNIPVSNGNINVNLNADKLDGNDASAFSPVSHSHSAATSSSNGFMANMDKAKLDGVATGAEVNQNAFSNVAVAGTTIQADNKTDTLTLEAGANIAITPDATNDKITIAVNGTVPRATSDKNGNDITTQYLIRNMQNVTDLNSAITEGSYLYEIGASNAPTNGWGYVSVRNTAISGLAGTWVYQTAFDTNGVIYQRCNINNNGWEAWKQIATTDGTIANAINDKNGLEIDTNYLKLSGGQVSGNIFSKGSVVAAGGFQGDLNGISDAANALRTIDAGGVRHNSIFNWVSKDGQPPWLWGGSDPNNMYVYNPSNFNVNSVGGYTAAQLMANAGGIVAQSLGANGYVKFSNGFIIQWGVGSINDPVTFPISFPTKCASVLLTPIGALSYGSSRTVNSIATTGFSPKGQDGVPFNYVAFGY